MSEKLFKKLNELAFSKNGLASNMTVEDIAKKHGISVEAIEVQLEKGMKVELEHTSSLDEARDIALDHLVEFPDYYDRLEKMEKEAEQELNEQMMLLTEEEKEIKKEIEKAKSFFGGEKVEGVDTNRFVRLWNRIRDTFKISIHVFIKLLNPLNWPKAIFMHFYSIIKSIATLGTRESEGLKLELQRLLKDISDGKYRGKSAKEFFADMNEIRKEHGFKSYSYLQEDVIRRDFNGEVNRDFDGNIIDEELEIEMIREEADSLNEAVSGSKYARMARKLELLARQEGQKSNPDEEKLKNLFFKIQALKSFTDPTQTDGRVEAPKPEKKKKKLNKIVEEKLGRK
jgi:hypothetical protein